jgi:hypothetical protein
MLGHLETNAEDEKKLTKLSVEPQDQGKRPDSPRKVWKGPDKGGVQLEKHPTGATSYEHSKTNVSNEVERNVPPNSPEATVCTQPCVPKRETRWLPDERSCSRVAEGPEPCHNDAVNERRSNLNVEPKRKLTNSSVEPREQGKDTDLPGKARKGPDKELGRVEMHLTGATNYERSETNVNDRMKLVFESPVRSSFWSLIRCNCNRNRLGPHPQFQATGPNRTQPVQIGLVAVPQPI